MPVASCCSSRSASTPTTRAAVEGSEGSKLLYQPTDVVRPADWPSLSAKGKRAALGSANRGSVHAPARVEAVALVE